MSTKNRRHMERTIKRGVDTLEDAREAIEETVGRATLALLNEAVSESGRVAAWDTPVEGLTHFMWDGYERRVYRFEYL